MANVITVNGHTYRDDAHPTQGMDNGGFRVRLIPMLGDIMTDMDSRIAAGQSGIDATADTVEADRQLAQDAKNDAETAADAAAASALTAINSPGTQASSTTSLAIGLGAKSLTLAQAGKAFVPGQYVTISRTSAPNQWMVGQITTFNPTTGDMAFFGTGRNGTGTYTDWTIVHGSPLEVFPDKAGKAGWLAAVNPTADGWELIFMLGLPDPAGHIGDQLVVNASGDAEWNRIRPLKTGALLQTCETLSAPDWLQANGSVYLQASYPTLFALVGIIEDGGPTWTAQSGALSNSERIIYNAGLWVLGGHNGSQGEIKTSPDAVTWTSRNTESTDGVYSLIFANSLYVAGYSGGKLKTSADGITWTLRTSQFGTGLIYGLAFGNGIFVAAGSSASNKVATSSDGLTWTGRGTAMTTGQFQDVAFGAGVFVAVTDNGEVRSSSDGVTWTLRTCPIAGSFSVSKFVNGKFYVANSAQQIASSTDGITWSSMTNPLGANNVDDITYGNGRYVMTGASGNLAISSDGTTWKSRTSGFASTRIKGVAYGNLKFAILGDAKLSTNTPYKYDISTQFVTPIVSVAAPIKSYLKA